MPLSPGTRLGPYELEGLLGAGGMGEVYQAVDTRLGRGVAVKVLPTESARDADRLRRFQREARAAASVSQANIVAVLDVGVEGEQAYIVLELLEGRTLREALEPGRLPARTVIDWGSQIVRGLQAAHGHGIVHRDLKPENVFVTSDGQVTILDFGLSLLSEPLPGGAGDDTRTATAAGMVMGTVGYMSPEQARGQRADERSDIFSLGAVLYDILAGRRAFSGASSADVISAILHSDPPAIGDADPTVAGLERVIRRCLEKDRARRFQTVADVGFALEAVADPDRGAGIRRGDATPPRQWRGRPGRRASVLIAGAGLLALALAFLAVRWRGAGELPRITDYDQITADRWDKYIPWLRAAPATDGTRVYFNEAPSSATNQIVQVAAAGGDVVPLAMPFRAPPILLDATRDGAELLVRPLDASLPARASCGGCPRSEDRRVASETCGPRGRRGRPTGAASSSARTATCSSRRRTGRNRAGSGRPPTPLSPRPSPPTDGPCV
jgi:hypothetical protein